MSYKPNSKRSTLIDDYLNYQLEYEKKYGKRTVVLMEVGSFFEIYGVDNDKEKIGKPKKISTILNIAFTRKNKSNPNNNRGNPLFCGFQSGSLDRMVTVLLKENFTIVLIEQVTPPPYPKREVTRILSPGTCIESSELQNGSNALVSIYIENEQIKGDPKNLDKCTFTIGLSMIDLTTGEGVLYETYSYKHDKLHILDEIYRFLLTMNPQEVIINSRGFPVNLEQQFVSYLELQKYNTHINWNNVDPDFFKIAYQNEFFKRIFKATGMLTPIEFLDLECKTSCTLSYILLLQFAYSHNENVVHKISIPNHWIESNHLVLTHNSINQLNLLPDNNFKNIPKIYKTKFNSLLSVIDHTETSLGKRLLKDKLLNPIINEDELNFRYNIVSELIEYQKVNKKNTIDKLLREILDIERLHRKQQLKQITTTDFFNLHLSYKIIKELNHLISQSSIFICTKLIALSNTQLIQFDNYIEKYTSKLCLDKLSNFNKLNDINESIFKLGYDPEIDGVQRTMDDIIISFNDIATQLSDIIDPSANGTLIKVSKTDKEGYFLTGTATKCKSLKMYKNKGDKSGLLPTQNELLNTLKFTELTSNFKIKSDFIKKSSYKLMSLKDKMKHLCKHRFISLFEDIYPIGKSNEMSVRQGAKPLGSRDNPSQGLSVRSDQHNESSMDLFKTLSKFISEFDMHYSFAKCSLKFNYCRPIIQTDPELGFINATQIRHPIIERILNDSPYIPNDIEIGKSMNGILLYGVNSAGKSSIMKAIGLNQILAQIGCFVAAKEYTFSPFTKIVTRITGNDNIFKHQSTFVLEMAELRSILSRSDPKTLVLGDEICRGTESISGLALVTSAVHFLAKKKTNFIFATHMHQLKDMELLKELDNISFCHLKVTHDPISDLLVYNRILQKGSGPSVYGLEVAKAMNLDSDFIAMANKIRRQIEGTPENILNHKTSRYNSKVYLHYCSMPDCNNMAQETHHIKEQCKADQNGFIDHEHKNVKSNLLPLCKKCHDAITYKKINVKGIQFTSEGLILDIQ